MNSASWLTVLVPNIYKVKERRLQQWRGWGGDATPILISEPERKALRKVLLRAFNRNQIIILKGLKNNRSRSLTSILGEISAKDGISLSTLKFNARILRDLDLIGFKKVSKKRTVQLTKLGRLILELVENEGSGEAYSKELNNKSTELKNRLLRVLRDVKNPHLDSSISCIDILLAVFNRWFHSDNSSSNVLILSKGHAAPALYLVLAEFGLLHERELETLGMLGSRLQLHAERNVPLIEVSTGSLGQGLSIANGIALAAKIDGSRRRVIVILGDGELDEGQIWEAAMTASNYRLDNLIAIVDRNGRQLTGFTEKIKRKEPLKDKWEAFGWIVIEANGHDHEQLMRALIEAEAAKGKPKVIIAAT